MVMIKMFAKIRGWFNFVHQTVNNYSNTLLMPMNDFIKSYSTNGITYISFPKFAEIRHQILTEPYRLIQFMGLSGIGKSRMIFEIFHGIDNSNNYYCSNASDDRLLNELSTFLRERMNEEGVIVLDDCNGDAFSKISKLRLEINTKYKIIGIYNDTEDIVRERGVNQLYLNRRDLLDSVNQYIQDQIGLLGNQAENIVRQIQDISDGFPVVAIKAIQSYRENGVTNLMNEDELWKKMCGYQSLTVDERVALQSLSLFEPLGYEQEFARDYQMVKYNENITPFDYNHLKIDDIFEKLVKSYKNKELIEINSCWLLVRPLPLAVWLVGQWFRNCGQNRFVQVLNDLDAIQEQAQANRMKRALCKRIQNMQDNEKAKYLFERLMAVGAPFHYEEVVCSDFGSQLFLAISTVNPVAVTNCLYDVVMPQSIDWTKNIKGDVRRNYIWCLERLSMPETTFRKAALLLAKFSLAENESWANNATGQLLQLFHVALSGTETTLRQRLDVIEELRTLGDEYIPIVLKVIDSAFSYSHFSRNAGYEHIDGKVYTDFEPMGVDICEYWEGCIKILGELLQYRPDSVNQIADIIVSHVYDLSLRSGCYDYLEKLINMVVNARGNEWPEMHKQLLKLKRYNQDRLSTERKAKIDGWLKLFGAKDFLLTLDEVHATFFYADNRELSFEDKMAHAVEYFTPIAKRFRDEKLYSDSELVLRLLDSQTNEIAFIRAISNVLTLQQVKELFDVIIKNIAGKAQDYQSSFLNILYFSLSESEAKRKFLQSIYDLKKYQQYIVLKTNSETSDLKVLKEVVDIINNKHISPKTSLRQYLYRVNIDSSERMFEVCSYIRKNVGNSEDILLDYIVANEFSSFILEGEMKTLTMELLLNYDYAKSTVDAYNVNSLVTNILESGKEVDFAISYNKKLLREIKDYDSFRVNEHLYYTLLPKYQDSILGDILKEISNRESDFWYFGGKDLGSGDGFGVGPLFQCNIETIKEVCLQESQGCLPYRLAYLAPVFDYSDKDEPSFSQFFYWLLEHFDSFKEQEEILSEFSSNMGSYSWVGSIIPLLEKKINCFKKLEHHTNTIVKKWVIENILSLSEQLRKEQNSESYRKLC